LFVGDSDDESDGDDDDCVEIPLVTPLRYAAVIPSSRNQGRSSTALAAEGPNTRDSQGKGIMADDAATPSAGVSRPRPSPRPVPSFRDVSGYAIHADFFPFLLEWDAPYRHTFGVLAKEVFKDPAVCKTMVEQFPTPGEMVQVESLFDDQLTAKMSVLHCMMMSHGGELLARYRGLLQSRHEYVHLADSRLKGFEEKVTGAAGLELQSKAKGKERKKKIKSLTKSLDNLHAEVVRLSAALNQATVLEDEKDEFLASDEFSRVQGELLSLADSAGFERDLSMHQTKDEFATVLKKMANFMPSAQDRLAKASPLDARVSPPTTKESIMTPASKSLELSANVDLTASVVAFVHNEEMVNAEVDRSAPKMTDDIVAAKSGHVFVQGTSVSLEDAVELVEKGYGLVPSSAAGKETAANSSRV
ncbi:hypothetical protein Tco_1233375, partial [Tanacetum coccineum]